VLLQVVDSLYHRRWTMRPGSLLLGKYTLAALLGSGGYGGV